MERRRFGPTKRGPNDEAHIVEYYLIVVADRKVTKLNPWDNFEGAKPPLGFSPSHVGVNSSTLATREYKGHPD